MFCALMYNENSITCFIYRLSKSLVVFLVRVELPAGPTIGVFVVIEVNLIYVFIVISDVIVSDIAIFVLKRDVKLQLTNY